MNSSDKSDLQANPLPFAAEGGVRYTTDPARDPFEALEELITVVEELCPTWPPRKPTQDGNYWLL